MLEETVELRKFLKGVLLSALMLPDVWGEDAIDGWVTTKDIQTVFNQHPPEVLACFSPMAIYPNLRALAKRGEIYWWPANQSLPQDGVPTVEALVKYGAWMQARWRLVVTHAPIDDVEALERWLAS